MAHHEALRVNFRPLAWFFLLSDEWTNLLGTCLSCTRLWLTAGQPEDSNSGSLPHKRGYLIDIRSRSSQPFQRGSVKPYQWTEGLRAEMVQRIFNQDLNYFGRSEESSLQFLTLAGTSECGRQGVAVWISTQLHSRRAFSSCFKWSRWLKLVRLITKGEYLLVELNIWMYQLIFVVVWKLKLHLVSKTSDFTISTSFLMGQYLHWRKCKTYRLSPRKSQASQGNRLHTLTLSYTKSFNE